MANAAASLQVAQPGVTAISRTDLRKQVEKSSPVGPSTGKPSARNPRTAEDPNSAKEPQTPSNSKLISTEAAQRLAEQYRQQGRTIVFTNGCFDLLHVGHLTCLEQAAQQGDILFVAINSDSSIRRLKGNTRPIIGEQDRAKLLTAIACVNHVLIFDEDTPHRLLEAIRPDILVKGGTTPDIVGREIVERYGGRVERTAEIPDISTTSLLVKSQTPERRKLGDAIPIDHPIHPIPSPENLVELHDSEVVSADWNSTQPQEVQ